MSPMKKQFNSTRNLFLYNFTYQKQFNSTQNRLGKIISPRKKPKNNSTENRFLVQHHLSKNSSIQLKIDFGTTSPVKKQFNSTQNRKKKNPL